MSDETKDLQLERAHTLTRGCINEKTYEIDDSFRPGSITPQGVHTTTELVALLESNPDIGLDALVLGADKNGRRGARMDRNRFIEAWKRNDGRSHSAQWKRMRESFNREGDSFDRGGNGFGNPSNIIGNDFTPILGGPFYHQLYLHDHLRMMALSFHAYHHDPIARALVNITVDFTLGRGFRVDSDNESALALWRAFEKVNDLQKFMLFVAREIATYGENLIWWLPGMKTYVEWQVRPGQEVPVGALPRLRLIDPSTCWEIITYPEDMERVLAYQLVFPTQYQIFTAKDGGSVVPSAKFIIQQVPAEQVQHYKVNTMSNEKRGRSDLYPALGYLKRLRDSIEYGIAGLQKASAWAIDTTIEGSLADMQAYVDDQNSQKTLAPPGSEFIHTPKIKRQYLGNEGTHSSGSPWTVEWCVNMACSAVQIPVNYLGMAIQGGATRASALVATEPVAKRFEMRQLVYQQILQGMWDHLMEMFGIEGAECQITFPEIIAQDATAKIKNLVLAQEVEALDHETMSTGIAQELGITNYDYDTTQEKVAADRQKDMAISNLLISPLTAKPAVPAAPKSSGGAQPGDSQTKPSAVTKSERRAIKIAR